MEAGLPYARSVIAITRIWVEAKELSCEDCQPSAHTRYFLTSLGLANLTEQKRGAKTAREHWSVENKNHYKRDTCQWREDDHRHRRINAAQNLALTRNALLAIIPFDEDHTLSEKFDNYQAYPSRAIKLIQQAHPI